MSAVEDRIAALPIWSGKVDLAPLAGGLSNISYLATDRAGRTVVRLARDYPFHGVYRERELVAARAANEAGFGPEVVYAETGVMVTRYIDGRVMTPATLRADIATVADFLRQFHRRMCGRVDGPANEFRVFGVNRHYAHLLAEDGRSDEAQPWLAVNNELEAAQLDLPRRFGHHDLLAANLIDDGDRLWLIDYEYAAFGDAMFDLANLSSNNGFSDSDSETLLAAYFDDAPGWSLRRAHAAMEAASLLREAMWSLVSATRLDAPGVDYEAYARRNFLQLEVSLAAYRQQFG